MEHWGQIVKLEIRALISEQGLLVNLIGLSSAILIMTVIYGSDNFFAHWRGCRKYARRKFKAQGKIRIVPDLSFQL